MAKDSNTALIVGVIAVGVVGAFFVFRALRREDAPGAVLVSGAGDSRVPVRGLTLAEQQIDLKRAEMEATLEFKRRAHELEAEGVRKKQEAQFMAVYGIPYRPWWSPEGPILEALEGIGQIGQAAVGFFA